MNRRRTAEQKREKREEREREKREREAMPDDQPRNQAKDLDVMKKGTSFERRGNEPFSRGLKPFPKHDCSTQTASQKVLTPVESFAISALILAHIASFASNLQCSAYQIKQQKRHWKKTCITVLASRISRSGMVSEASSLDCKPFGTRAPRFVSRAILHD